VIDVRDDAEIAS